MVVEATSLRRELKIRGGGSSARWDRRADSQNKLPLLEREKEDRKMRSSITATVQRVQGLVDQVNALSEDERAFFFDLIDPLPEEPEAAQPKKTRKKRKPNVANAKPRGLPKNAPPLLTDTGNKTEGASRCGVCGNDEDYQDHFQPSPHYHEFRTAA